MTAHVPRPITEALSATGKAFSISINDKGFVAIKLEGQRLAVLHNTSNHANAFVKMIVKRIAKAARGEKTHVGSV